MELNKYLGLGVEPGFTQRGAACVPGWGIFINDSKLFLNYVELPVMISANLPVYKATIEAFGKLGYSLSMITSAYQEVVSLVGDEPPVRTKMNVSNNRGLNRWDHGILGGLGIAYNVGRNQIFLEARYYYGLRNVEPWNFSQNRTLQFGLGYLMCL